MRDPTGNCIVLKLVQTRWRNCLLRVKQNPGYVTTSLIEVSCPRNIGLSSGSCSCCCCCCCALCTLSSRWTKSTHGYTLIAYIQSSKLQIPRFANTTPKVKSFASHMAHRAALISVSLAFSQTPVYTARVQDHGYGASASRGVPVYAPALNRSTAV